MVYDYYKKELDAHKKSNRLRQRKLFDKNLIDFASNDYLGLASNKDALKKAFKKLYNAKEHSPKASMLVNGYHPIHHKFEKALALANNFEKGLVVGSGFLANMALLESMIRKKDLLFIDEEYHASGIVATKLLSKENVIFFKHNDPEDLRQKLQSFQTFNRRVIAIEGIYSMQGDIAKKDFYEIANKHNAILIVDEAHSSGVIGENLLGWFDHFSLPVLPNHIKLGTLGKAYGSYGAYILASQHIITFLENRAKSIIYTTAPSLFDIALAHENFKLIQKNKEKLIKKIKKRQKLIQKSLGLQSDSLIIPIEIGDNNKALQLQEILKQNNYLVGAIRQPTVTKAIIRLIPKIDNKLNHLKKILQLLKENII